MKRIDFPFWYWLIIGAVFFIPFLGGVHLFDWDEINFAELAREMVVSGDWLQMQINYAEFTEKPPLFFWIQAISMSVFGEGEFAARLPNAILGTLVLPYLYLLGKRLVDKSFGALWALSWFGSILPFLYFKSGLIDPLFNFFIFNGILFLILSSWKDGSVQFKLKKSRTSLVLIGGAFIGLGILTKGPVAYLLVFLTWGVLALLRRFKLPISFIDFTKFSLSALGVFLLWFALDFLIRGPEFLIEFTIRQWELLTTGDAGHSGFFGYHFVVLLLGCFPASIFAIPALRKKASEAHLEDFRIWMVVLFWVVLILFSLVGTKIIHYSSMAYYPLTFLSALTLWRWSKDGEYKRWFDIGIAIIGAVIILICIALPYAGMHPELILPLMEADPFATANMDAQVPWSTFDYIPAIIAGVVVLGYFYWKRKNSSRAIHHLFGGMGVWVFITLIFFIGKVERISQRANVEFFENQVGESVYVTTYGYKSYVPWYYARIQPHSNDSAVYSTWLLHGRVDRPVKISVKINKVEEFKEKVPDAKLIYAKNGFYFFERPAFRK